MAQEYYTAEEAAKVLGLEYFTFLARVRRGMYTYEMLGRRVKLFRKADIHKAMEDHATDRANMETSTR